MEQARSQPVGGHGSEVFSEWGVVLTPFFGVSSLVEKTGLASILPQRPEQLVCCLALWFRLSFVLLPELPMWLSKRNHSVYVRRLSPNVFKTELVLMHGKPRHVITQTFVCQVDWSAGNKEPSKWQKENHRCLKAKYD